MNREKYLRSHQFQSNTELVRFYMKPYWGSLILASILTLLLGFIGSVVATIIGPTFKILTSSNPNEIFYFSELLGDRVGGIFSFMTNMQEITSKKMMNVFPYVLVVLAGAKTILFLSQWYIWEKLGEKIARDIRQDIINLYLYLDPRSKSTDLGKKRDGNLSSNITTDIKLLKEYVVRFYGGVPREFLQVLFLGITLFLLSSKLFLIFFVGIIPSVVLVSRLGKKIRRRANKALEDYSTLTEWLQQRLLGIETIKHYKTEEFEAEKMNQLSLGLYEKFYQSIRVKARTSPLLELVAISALVLVIYISFLDISNGLMTGSIVMSFLTTLGMLSQSAGKVGKYYNTNRDGSVAVSRINNIFTFFQSHQAADLHLNMEKNIEKAPVLICENVSVEFSESIKAIQNLSYKFQSGKIYCVCGKSGAGKSTLFNLLLGLLKPNSGKISLNKENPAIKHQKSLPLCYMPQSVVLMPGTVLENIYYPFTEGDELKAKEALNKVGLLKDIEKLDHGMNTKVGEGGQGLSGGQAQRVLLSRLWYHQSPVILIDEGTSSLDPEIEQMIYSFLKELVEVGCTVIMIAHRLSATKISDIILLLEDGRLILDGEREIVLSSKEFKELIH